MTAKKIVLIVSALAWATVLVHAQEGSSLADVSRRVRAEKEKKAAVPDPATTDVPKQPAATPAAGMPVAGAQQTKPGPQTPLVSQENNQSYEQRVRELFDQEKFEALDQMADSARSSKTRLPGGFWALHVFYLVFDAPLGGLYESTDGEWTAFLQRLGRWVQRRPQSITARVALAKAQLSYAWKARGGGYADSVSNEGWRLFQERTGEAAGTLVEAGKLPAKCPEWFLAMQLVARAAGQDLETQMAIFEKAIAFEPDYQYFYRVMAETLLPKWEGEEGQAAEFAEQVANRLAGKRGDFMYYQIASFLNCGCDTDNLNGMSWPRIKRGYEALEAQYGVSTAHLNEMAYMAGIAGDAAYAEKTFARFSEDQWDEVLWQNKTHFYEVREWAGAAAKGQTLEAALHEAEDNQLNPEGNVFGEKAAQLYNRNFGSAVADCMKQSGETTLVSFSLIVQLGDDGTVKRIYPAPFSRISACVSARVEKARFPAPPRPNYWVMIRPAK